MKTVGGFALLHRRDNRMEDYIIKATAANHQVRVFASTTKNLVETARQIHNTSPVATAALGRLLTAGAIMGSMCKNPTDLVTLQIKCSGPIKGLVVTADAQANVKGYVHEPCVILPANEKGKLDVSKALDLGVLSVIKDIGLKEPYVGQTHLVSGEIAEDLTYYFATSEQIPTSVALGVLMNKNNTVKQAGGFLIQLMPSCEDAVISSLEKRLADFSSITSLLDENLSPEAMMEQLFEGFGFTILERRQTEFHCNCSKERVADVISSLQPEDLQEMKEDGKPIEVRCHFCNSVFTEVRL